MSSYQKLSIIVPAYNKDSEVFKSICGYVNELKHTLYDWEIIVVDDASRDQTLREAVRSKKFNGNSHRIKIFSYNLNQGKGFALYYGFKRSSGDIVAFADSDLDLPSQNITSLLKAFKQARPDIAIGSKRHPLSQVNYPLVRRFMSKSYQILISLLFNMNISDTQVGVKIFKREVLEAAFPRIVIKRFAFDLELLVVAGSLGFNKIIECPVILNYNFTSTINFKAIKQILVDTLAIYYRKYVLNYYVLEHHNLSKDETILDSYEAFA